MTDEYQAECIACMWTVRLPFEEMLEKLQAHRDDNHPIKIKPVVRVDG